MRKPRAMPIGRFAPSPTGNLHLGSLTTAIASYCHIRSIGGRWLLRLEDTDSQRCHPSFSSQIQTDLQRLGLYWDEAVCSQSKRIEIYNHYLQPLNSTLSLMHSQSVYSHRIYGHGIYGHVCGHTQTLPLKSLIYGCECSRKQLHGTSIYPRYCLHKVLDMDTYKVRVQMPDYSVGFLDKLQGMQWQNPQQTLGDVVLRRADGLINYFLAVSIDDGLQGVTHVMRGLDILPLTCAQIVLMDYVNLPAIEHWYHLPLVTNNEGQKLSKQNLATPIDTSTPAHCRQLIITALSLLSQPDVVPDTPERMLAQAVARWDNQALRKQTKIMVPK